jgi:hypothetical protein
LQKATQEIQMLATQAWGHWLGKAKNLFLEHQKVM